MFAMSFLIAFQSIAFAAPASGLKSAYEEYLYATTVEWDQIDSAEIAAINSRFADSLASLQEQGLLTDAHVKEFFHDEVSAGRVPQEVLFQILTPAGELNSAALVDVLREQQKNLQDRGASWDGNGRKIFNVVAWGFLPALLVVYLITTSGRKELCTNSGNGYGLNEPFPCN